MRQLPEGEQPPEELVADLTLDERMLSAALREKSEAHMSRAESTGFETALRSRNPQGFRAYDQPIGGHQRRELHHCELHAQGQS